MNNNFPCQDKPIDFYPAMSDEQFEAVFSARCVPTFDDDTLDDVRETIRHELAMGRTITIYSSKEEFGEHAFDNVQFKSYANASEEEFQRLINEIYAATNPNASLRKPRCPYPRLFNAE